MDTQDATNPVAEEEHVSTPAEGVAEAEGARGDDQELDEDGNPIEGQAEDDSEEIEHEGVKAKVPKALAKFIREGALRQDDYTRKTQEVAEQRRTVEAERAALAQQAEAQAQTLGERATLRAVEDQLQQYAQVDWQALAAQGEGAVAQAMAHMRQLETARDQLKDQITSKEREHVRLSSERQATARQEAAIQLQRDHGITPEVANNVEKLAGSLGFSREELLESLTTHDGKPDTRSFRVLARLHAAEAKVADYEAKAKKAQTAEKQAAVTPAKTVRPNGGQYKPGLDDSLPPDEWLRRRQAQLQKRA